MLSAAVALKVYTNWPISAVRTIPIEFHGNCCCTQSFCNANAWNMATNALNVNATLTGATAVVLVCSRHNILQMSMRALREPHASNNLSQNLVALATGAHACKPLWCWLVFLRSSLSLSSHELVPLPTTGRLVGANVLVKVCDICEYSQSVHVSACAEHAVRMKD